MVSALKLEFPEFITHIPQSKLVWIKIGYNKIHASVHYTTRAALVAAMHGYIEKHIPENLTIQGPIETKLTVYAPINFGNMKMVMDKETNKRKVQWKPAPEGYKPNWDIGNLALIWLKCLDDVLIKKGILPDDTVEYLRRTTYEFIPVANLRDRKLVYNLKTIKANGVQSNRKTKSELTEENISKPKIVPKRASQVSKKRINN
jgi:hypothetical protein